MHFIGCHRFVGDFYARQALATIVDLATSDRAPQAAAATRASA